MSRWPERVYAIGGAAGLALVGLAYLLSGRHTSSSALVIAAASALVVIAWMIEGLAYHRRRRREEAAAARHREAQAQERARIQEANAAAKRAAQTVNAGRHVSHGGMTISVHRRANEDLAHTMRDGETASHEPDEELVAHEA